MTYITEQQFREKVALTLGWMVELEGGAWRPKLVVGPGRSGAIASVYVSHFLHVPWVPYGVDLPDTKSGLLIVDTAMKSGRTIRKAARKYDKHLPMIQWFYDENQTGRVRFWYEQWEENG